MLEFTDLLYGTVTLPDWIEPFVKLPEFVRLRGVRLSNVDSYQFKDFGGPARWEHSIAVAALATRCAAVRRLPECDRVHLILAALLHDVATPPFAHTGEYVLENFDHEIETERLLAGASGSDFCPDTPVFASQLPQFRRLCKLASSRLHTKIDPDEVAQMVVGKGKLGYLIRGTLDLDNADNVTRACRYLGINVDPDIPIRLAEWLAQQEYPPTDLKSLNESAVQEWLEYRRELYSRFYTSSDEELGRQAFLQHLMRRAVSEGLPRRSLVWNTDEHLLFAIERLDTDATAPNGVALRELVQRYRLLEAAFKLVQIDIDSEEVHDILRRPQAAGWLEDHISTPTLEVFVMVSSVRHEQPRIAQSLFHPPLGSLFVFKLGHGLKRQQLPTWLQAEVPDAASGSTLLRAVSRGIGKQLNTWIEERPWMKLTQKRQENIVRNLEAIGNWDFRLSRNESMHPYPSTFVHAIPASLIASLGVQGERIIDPFAGTGQTAVEAVKFQCNVISGDLNSIACLAARAKLTYLTTAARLRLQKLEPQDYLACQPTNVPDFDRKRKWFHPKTLDELCRIHELIRTRRDQVSREFLLASFSAILTSCTGRKGEQHGYFADNCPLEKGKSSPPYRPAADLFSARVRMNLVRVAQFYGTIERQGRDPERELQGARVVRADATNAKPSDYGVHKNTAAAIITSPPYLCMADYALGQRLSYYLIEPELIDADFEHEMGARRRRFQPEQALEEYRKDMSSFAALAALLLRPRGFLAVVLGEPVAKPFRDLKLVKEVDSIFEGHGFTLLWHKWRPINWHRNHGYARLKTERVSVYVAGG